MNKQFDIPNGWCTKRISYLIKSMDAGVSVNSEDRKADLGEYGILKTSCVTSGVFNADENKVILTSEVKRARISPSCDKIIMSRMNTPALVGANAYVPKTINNLFLPDRLWLLTPKEGRVSMRWLAFVLGSPKYRSKLSSLATGTSNSMKNITKRDVNSLPVLLPPLPEQKAIADLLSTWDKAIEKTERLIQVKERRFRWLLRKLMSPTAVSSNSNYECLVMNGETESNLELSNHHSELENAVSKPRNTQNDAKWKKVKLGDVSEVAKKEKLHSLTGCFLITVKLHCVGIKRNDRSIPKLTKRGRPYFRHQSGDFLIGRQNFHNGGFGIVPSELDGGITSNAITCLLVDKSQLSKNFLFFQLSDPNYYKRIGHIMDGTGQKELSDKQILKLMVCLPDIRIQKQIANILSAAQYEIDLLKQLAEKYKTQKLGLMQKMLTGEWRIYPDIIMQYEQDHMDIKKQEPFKMLNFKNLDKLKQKLDSFRPLPPEIVSNLHEDLVLRWTYHSNAIEGNTLTLKETKVALEGITVGGKTMREHLEVINHREAIFFVEDLVKKNEGLSEWQVKSIHQLVLKNIDDKNAGVYRKTNAIISGADHVPPDALHVKSEMQSFMDWYKNEGARLHPVERAARVHADFVKIHPFVDGNGRTARLLMNLELMKSGFPPAVLPVDRRLEYYESLDIAHTKNDNEPFLRLISEIAVSGFDPYWHALRLRDEL